MSDPRAVHVIVTGFVQGVGFRRQTLAEADRLGVSGWVKNLANGNVELSLEGAPAQVTSMLAWLRQGPRGADVTDVRTTEQAPTGVMGFSTIR